MRKRFRKARVTMGQSLDQDLAHTADADILPDIQSLQLLASATLSSLTRDLSIDKALSEPGCDDLASWASSCMDPGLDTAISALCLPDAHLAGEQETGKEADRIPGKDQQLSSEITRASVSASCLFSCSLSLTTPIGLADCCRERIFSCNVVGFFFQRFRDRGIGTEGLVGGRGTRCQRA